MQTLAGLPTGASRHSPHTMQTFEQTTGRVAPQRPACLTPSATQQLAARIALPRAGDAARLVVLLGRRLAARLARDLRPIHQLHQPLVPPVLLLFN